MMGIFRFSVFLKRNSNPSKIMTRSEILTQRYFDKTITTDELDELTRLMQEEGMNEKDLLYREMEAELRARKIISQDVREHVSNRFVEPAEEKPAVVPMYRSTTYAWRAAAVVIFALGLGLYVKVFKNTNAPTVTAREEITPVIVVSAKKPEFVVLPDKSTVILNAGSELTYSKTYGMETREVFLKGEAFFDIQPDPERKFIVHSGDITTTVLGTAFNVKALPDQKEVVVAVARGKVAVKDSQQEFGTITPNEQFTVNIESHICVRSKVKVESSIAWMNQFIIIDNQTFEQAVEIIEERFDVRIKVENAALKSCKITVTFLDKPKLDDVLTVISTLVKATYTMNSSNITIHGGEECK